MVAERWQGERRAPSGVGQSFGRLHVIPRLKAFQARYPDLELEKLSLFDHRTNLVDEGLDLWITTYEDKPESLVGQRLADIGFVLVASPDYLLSHGTPLHPRIWPITIASPTRAGERRYHEWSFRQGKERQTVQVAGNYRVDLAEAVRDAALAGSASPMWPTTCWTRSCNLVSSSLCCPSGNRTRRWRCTPSMPGEHLDPKIRLFIDFLKESFGPGPYWAQRLAPWLGEIVRHRGIIVSIQEHWRECGFKVVSNQSVGATDIDANVFANWGCNPAGCGGEGRSRIRAHLQPHWMESP